MPTLEFGAPSTRAPDQTHVVPRHPLRKVTFHIIYDVTLFSHIIYDVELFFHIIYDVELFFHIMSGPVYDVIFFLTHVEFLPNLIFHLIYDVESF